MKDSSLTDSLDRFLPTPLPHTCCLAARLDIKKIFRMKKMIDWSKIGIIVFRNMTRTQ
jgi:hypothetical protein